MPTATLTGNQTDFLNIFKAIETLSDETTIEISESGLMVRAMDPSHIALVNVEYPPSRFQNFNAPESVKFGVRLSEVVKALKRMKDSITLTVDGNLIIKSDKVEFSLRTIEPFASSTPLPKLKLESKITVSRDELQDTLETVHIMSEYVRIETDDESAVLSGNGDAGKSTVTLDEADISGSGKSTYSLDYLVKIVKAVDAEQAILEFSSKMPLKITLDRIEYYLAPRVQD